MEKEQWHKNLVRVKFLYKGYWGVVGSLKDSQDKNFKKMNSMNST